MVQKEPSVQKKHPKQLHQVSHNPLDSTSPLVKKGKQREVPKAKKPTPLKRVRITEIWDLEQAVLLFLKHFTFICLFPFMLQIILKEREERKQNRLLEEQGSVPRAEESRVSSNPREDLLETAVSQEDPQGLIGADRQMLGNFQGN